MSLGGSLRRPGVLLGLAAALAAGPAGAAPAEAPADVIDCTTVPKNADEAALVKRFGRAAVTSVRLDAAEGETEAGTAVNARDPARRLNLFWTDSKRRRGPASVVIRDRSRWRIRLPNGATLGLGAGPQEVEAANGRPFAVSGFFWDYGGYATDWKGGALPRLPGGCTMTVRFDPDPKAPGKAADRVSGEKTFLSSDPALRAVSPTVSVLTLDWPN